MTRHHEKTRCEYCKMLYWKQHSCYSLKNPDRHVYIGGYTPKETEAVVKAPEHEAKHMKHRVGIPPTDDIDDTILDEMLELLNSPEEIKILLDRYHTPAQVFQAVTNKEMEESMRKELLRIYVRHGKRGHMGSVVVNFHGCKSCSHYKEFGNPEPVKGVRVTRNRMCMVRVSGALKGEMYSCDIKCPFHVERESEDEIHDERTEASD